LTYSQKLLTWNLLPPILRSGDIYIAAATSALAPQQQHQGHPMSSSHPPIDNALATLDTDIDFGFGFDNFDDNFAAEFDFDCNFDAGFDDFGEFFGEDDDFSFSSFGSDEGDHRNERRNRRNNRLYRIESVRTSCWYK